MNIEDTLKKQEASLHAERIEILMQHYANEPQVNPATVKSILYHAEEYKRITGTYYIRQQPQIKTKGAFK